MDLEEMLQLNKFLVSQIKHARNEEGRRMKRQLVVGSLVSFEDNGGQTVQGKVVKVMRKYARVELAHTRGQFGQAIWRVPLSYLTKVA
jgi:hypothetical protein